MLIPLLFSFLLLHSSSGHYSYDKEENELIRRIQKARVEGLKKEKESNGKYFESEWLNDLSPFVGGISSSLLDTTSPHANKYQIVNHTVYRTNKCVFSTRCQGIDKVLRDIASQLSDTVFYINDFDTPKAHKSGPPIPIFSFSKKDDEYWDILYPTWSFYEGGPSISTYPMGIGQWEQTRMAILNSSSSIEWNNRQSKGFFLGSRTNSQRDQLVLLSRVRPDLVDASFTKNQAYKGPKDTLYAQPAKEESFEYNCQFKFLFNFRGVAASFRLKHLFLCGSVVMHVDDGWREFFYHKLIPYYHYIPVEDNTKEGLTKLLQFAREHDEEMKRIGDQGREWTVSHLSLNDVHNYWKGLLRSYTSLLTFPVILDPSLIQLHS